MAFMICCFCVSIACFAGLIHFVGNNILNRLELQIELLNELKEQIEGLDGAKEKRKSHLGQAGNTGQNKF